MSYDKTRLDKDGREILDDTPMVVSSGLQRPLTLAEQVQRIVRSYSRNQAEADGFETFEEAEDFDVDDEIDPSSQYEEHFDPILGKGITADEFRRAPDIYRERYLKAQKAYFDAQDAENALLRPKPAAPAAPKSGEAAAPPVKE